MKLADWFRAAVHRVKLSRPSTASVAALPAPRELLALPAPPGDPVCPNCGHRHPPVRRLPAAPAYDRIIVPELNPRPAPLGRGPAHDRAVVRDQHRPWRER